MKWFNVICFGIIFVCLTSTIINNNKTLRTLNSISQTDDVPPEKELKGDRVDKICGNSNYAVCLIAKDHYGYSGHKNKFTGCGCGETKEDAVAFAITGWVNQHFYVDFEVLINDFEGSHELLSNRVFSFYEKMEKKRNSRKYRKWRN